MKINPFTLQTPNQCGKSYLRLRNNQLGQMSNIRDPLTYLAADKLIPCRSVSQNTSEKTITRNHLSTSRAKNLYSTIMYMTRGVNNNAAFRWIWTITILWFMIEEQIKPFTNMGQLITCRSIVSIPDLSPPAQLLE